MKLRCRKCRTFLIKTSCLVNSHGEEINDENNLENTCCLENQKDPIWYVNYEIAPSWLGECLDMGNWTRGKLFCPKCRSRLGSFNFVQPKKCACATGIAHPLWMMKSKIDLAIIPVPRVPKPIVVDSTWTIIGESSNTIHKLASPERQQTPKDEASSTGIASSGQTTNETSLASTSSTNFSNNNLSERILAKRMKALRKKYQRNKIKKDQSYGRIEITNLNQKTYPVREEEIKQNNSCPICLDIYYKPTKCLPCAHMFCDPCLRQFSLYSDLVTCPVCRQDIASFKEINGLSTKLRQLFPNEYKWRQNQVKRFKINQINLPQPIPQAQ